MNEHEIERIACAMHALRPDWPAASLRTLIAKKLGDRPRRDVTVALAWVACESNSATPARVLEAGPWWKAAGVEGSAQARDPYDANRFCNVCGKSSHPGPSDHPFETEVEHARKLAHDGPRPRLPRATPPPATTAPTDGPARGET